MSTTTSKRPLRRTIRGGRPFFFADTAVDKVLNMVVTLGSEAAARTAGKLRLEGKEYVVKDGDVMHFRFNV